IEQIEEEQKDQKKQQNNKIKEEEKKEEQPIILNHQYFPKYLKTLPKDLLYIINEIKLYKNLSLSRNQNWTKKLQQEFLFEDLTRLIFDHRLHLELRSALCGLILTLYVDQEPLKTQKIPQICRVYKSKFSRNSKKKSRNVTQICKENLSQFQYLILDCLSHIETFLVQNSPKCISPQKSQKQMALKRTQTILADDKKENILKNVLNKTLFHQQFALYSSMYYIKLIYIILFYVLFRLFQNMII
ncbi:MIR domain protein, partial [Ichthyophthirius multifiliis]